MGVVVVILSIPSLNVCGFLITGGVGLTAGGVDLTTDGVDCKRVADGVLFRGSVEGLAEGLS